MTVEARKGGLELHFLSSCQPLGPDQGPPGKQSFSTLPGGKGHNPTCGDWRLQGIPQATAWLLQHWTLVQYSNGEVL